MCQWYSYQKLSSMRLLLRCITYDDSHLVLKRNKRFNRNRANLRHYTHLVNIIVYSMEGKRIKLKTRSDGNYLYICVFFILSTKSNNVRSNRIIYLQQSTIDYNMLFCFFWGYRGCDWVYRGNIRSGKGWVGRGVLTVRVWRVLNGRRCRPFFVRARVTVDSLIL